MVNSQGNVIATQKRGAYIISLLGSDVKTILQDISQIINLMAYYYNECGTKFFCTIFQLIAIWKYWFSLRLTINEKLCFPQEIEIMFFSHDLKHFLFMFITIAKSLNTFKLEFAIESSSTTSHELLQHFPTNPCSG